MRVYYSDDYVAAPRDHPQRATTQKAGWVVDSLRGRPISGVELVAPDPLTEEQLRAVHDEAYVRAVCDGTPRSLAQSAGFAWGADIWPAVCASNGGVVAAALAARSDGVSGSLSSGLHHARRDTGRGFCAFNGLALAARAALDAGARAVLILDLDAHCGGGTCSLIAPDARIWQADVAVNAFDRYDPAERCSLELVRDARDYLPAVMRTIDRVERDGPDFDLCLYNAGMDPDERCPIGGLAGINQALLAERERLVFSWARERRLPIAFVLAGGYSDEDPEDPTHVARLSDAALVDLHRLTLSEATQATA